MIIEKVKTTRKMSAFSLESVASDDGELKFILFIFFVPKPQEEGVSVSNFHRNAIGNLLEISNYSTISCVLEYLQYFPRNTWHKLEHLFL